MNIDKYGQIIFSEHDICDLYLKNPDANLKKCLVDKSITFDSNLELKNIPDLINYTVSNLEIQEWDSNNQKNWLMPEEYKNFDIALFVLSKCTTDAELQRVGEELILYQERGMFPLLQYLKYLVDTMRKNNIVWGVGRGSSVSSFVLFLIGVHRINSLYYDLSIDEFLR